MPPCPKHLLILFDWDGCTAIIESSRVQFSRKKVLSKSSRGTLSYEGRLHKVEILELSDSKEELEDYDTEWEQTHRALAISSEREKRQNSRGRRKMGGYLDIWNDPEIMMKLQKIFLVHPNPSSNNHSKRIHQSAQDLLKRDPKAARLQFCLKDWLTQQIQIFHQNVLQCIWMI